MQAAAHDPDDLLAMGLLHATKATSIGPLLVAKKGLQSLQRLSWVPPWSQLYLCTPARQLQFCKVQHQFIDFNTNHCLLTQKLL